MKYKRFTNITMFISLLMLTLSCSKSESYSELLREEEKAVNWYLAEHNVCNQLPEDPKDMITSETAGENAPFYRLDEDGYVYMQVVSANFDEMVEPGEVVYFRFNRQNLKYLYEGIDASIDGNSDYLSNGATKFVYKNTYLSSSTSWGTGIQMPMRYLGYNSEVNLVLRSYYGFTDEQSLCIPYIINLRYFKPEY